MVVLHGVGDSYDEAEDDLLDALVSYTEERIEELRFAPNRRANAPLVEREGHLTAIGQDR